MAVEFDSKRTRHFQVSADFLRLNGSRQQFRNLLSTRKKLGSLPPAYTRIDYSRDSLDSNCKHLVTSSEAAKFRVFRIASNANRTLVMRLRALVISYSLGLTTQQGIRFCYKSTVDVLPMQLTLSSRTLQTLFLWEL